MVKQNISLFLGAGASTAAGMSSTDDITKRIMSGKGVIYDQGFNQDRGRFYIREHKTPDSCVNIIISFLRIIKREITVFFNKSNISYEDLYYIVRQIKDFTSEYENPIVVFFVEKIKPLVKKELNFDKKDFSWTIAKLASYSVAYIADVVTALLSHKPANIDYLSFIKELIEDANVGSINIFTLNHDTVLEHYLKKNKMSYSDGFVDETGIRHWQPGSLADNSGRLRLLKLHGSVNWYRYKQGNKEFYGSRGLDNQEKKADIKQIGVRPLILTGRVNKILEYHRSIYVDLHYNFYRLLPSVDSLIIAGYSFGDQGINSWIINWMNETAKHKILLLGPDTVNCIKYARKGIRDNWYLWEKQKKAYSISIPVESFSWQDYSQLLF
ncbi:MAG: hypothetical protein FH762_11155 [Firmicutes bacterium]|nr:hypothetical protein [Bacillota bacterium]